jgi:hypothetical protein
VAEEVDDGDDADPDPGGLADQPGELALAVGVPAGDAGQAGEFDRVLQVEVELAVAPVRVARQLREEPVEALHLAAEVPLERRDHPSYSLEPREAPGLVGEGAVELGLEGRVEDGLEVRPGRAAQGDEVPALDDRALGPTPRGPERRRAPAGAR